MNNTVDLSAFYRAVRDELGQRARETGKSVLSELVARTPVRTGTARGNWTVTLNEPDRSFSSDRKDPAGNDTIASGERVIDSMIPGDRVCLSNSTPYILFLEEGYGREPGGMVHAAATRLRESSDS